MVLPAYFHLAMDDLPCYTTSCVVWRLHNTPVMFPPLQEQHASYQIGSDCTKRQRLVKYSGLGGNAWFWTFWISRQIAWNPPKTDNIHHIHQKCPYIFRPLPDYLWSWFLECSLSSTKLDESCKKKIATTQLNPKSTLFQPQLEDSCTEQ